MSFPKYEEYRESGIEWIGEIPDHWCVERFKRSTLSCKNGVWGSEAKGDANDIACVRVADFDRESLCTVRAIPTVRNVTESERNERTLAKGNLILEKSGGGDLQPVGFVVLYDLDESAVCSNFTAKIQLAEGMDPSFWRYCHSAAYSVRLNSKSIKQTSGIQNLDQSQYLNERAPFPPLPEQKAIASFLDAETSKIDALVAEQRRLIELLKEKRQAVISHAVTKGLDPHVKLKPSGIEWLGDVPEHWEVKQLRRFNCNVQTGPFGSQLHANEYIFNGTPVINPTHIVNGGIVPSVDSTVNADVLERLPQQLLKVGDVIFSRRGELGRCALVTKREDGWLCGTGSMILRLHQSEYCGGYLRFFLSLDLVRQFFESFSIGSVMNSLSSGTLLSMPLIVPPIEEQNQIVHFAAGRTMMIESLQAEAQRAIELLQERRTALISAAVTGKIDVRNFVPQEVA